MDSNKFGLAKDEELLDSKSDGEGKHSSNYFRGNCRGWFKGKKKET